MFNTIAPWLDKAHERMTQLRRAFDARPRRERLLLIGAGIAVAWMLADTLWLTPAYREWSAVLARRNAAVVAVKQLNVDIQLLDGAQGAVAPGLRSRPILEGGRQPEGVGQHPDDPDAGADQQQALAARSGVEGAPQLRQARAHHVQLWSDEAEHQRSAVALAAVRKTNSAKVGPMFSALLAPSAALPGPIALRLSCPNSRPRNSGSAFRRLR